MRGYNHKMHDIVCQDASFALDDYESEWHLAIVSDGHGDPTCMRSDRGSKMAVEAAKQTLSEFVRFINEQDINGRALHDDLLTPARRGAAMRRLTDAILFNWRQRAIEDFNQNPLSPEEIADAGDEALEQYARGEGIEHVYGATLICALQTSDLLLLIQQGDGSCTVAYSDGTIEDPIEEDPRCYANVTTSLCDPDAADGIRHAVLDLSERPIIACVVASDGVENSFASAGLLEGYLKRQLADFATDGNVERASATLAESLEELSQTGSGDDMSLAAIVDVDAVRSITGTFLVDAKEKQIEQRVRELKDKQTSMHRKHDYLKEQSEIAEIGIEKKNATIDNLRTQIQKHEDGEKQLEQKIMELEEERTQLEAYIARAPFNPILRLKFRNSRFDMPSFDEYIAQLKAETKELDHDITRRKRAWKRINRKRIELEEILERQLSQPETPDENTVREYEEYDARYQALEDEIQELEAEMTALRNDETGESDG